MLGGITQTHDFSPSVRKGWGLEPFHSHSLETPSQTQHHHSIGLSTDLFYSSEHKQIDLP